MTNAADQLDDKAEAQQALIEAASRGDLEPGAVFRHYKGGLYTIVCLSVKEDTLEPLVTYRSIERGSVWTRTLQNWSEYVDGLPRFWPV